MPLLADVIAVLDRWYDPRWAEPWDAIGLVCGDPAEPVERVLLAVDAVPRTVEEAIAGGAQLLLTHHPLLLTGVHGVPATDPKGALVHRMIRGGAAHFVAHTNADVADPGVSDALAQRVGLTELRPLASTPSEPLDKIVVFVPISDAERLIDALADAGAGQLGAYERCAWTVAGVGTFRPTARATPTIGRAGQLERVPEARIEMVLPIARREQVVRAMRAAHPYEEPAFDLFSQAPLASTRGSGRIGHLVEPTTLRAFVALAAAALPPTTGGVRTAGDPDRRVQTVAVCGGSGASLIEDARHAGADAYLTADLKHHTAGEAVTERGGTGMALVDAAHWATEAPWLDLVARQLQDEFGGAGLKVTVSTQRTDPWTLHVPSTESSLPAS